MQNIYGQLLVLFARICASSHLLHVDESSVFSITDPEGFSEHSSSKNVQLDGRKIILRSSDGAGSIVNLANENLLDDWAVELAFQRLVLGDMQRAGLYFWYTDDKLEEGPLLGGQHKFTGFLAGIEFQHSEANLVFSYNPGVDYSAHNSTGLYRDLISPNILDGVNDMIMKIIHTKNNFKIELYNGEKLIFDSLRLAGALNLVHDSKPKHFGLTTSYDECPPGIAFHLNRMSVAERREDESYNLENHHTQHNDFPRTASEIELRHAIADANYFITYLALVLGSDDHNVLASMVVKIKEMARRCRTKLDGLITALKQNTTDNSIEVEKRAEDFDRRLLEIYNNVEQLKNSIIEAQAAGKEPLMKVSNILIVFAILISALYLVKQLAVKYAKRKTMAKEK